MKINYIFLFIILLTNNIYSIYAQDSSNGKIDVIAENEILDLLTIRKCNIIKDPSVRSNNPCQGKNEVAGYMINVITSKQESDINQAIQKVRNSFPTLRIEKNYNQPDWRLFVGDYFVKKSAETDLAKVRKLFPHSIIVRWRVYCSRAK